MFRRLVIQDLVGILAILCIFGVPFSYAQSVCSGLPYLGTNGPELCVHVQETPAGASMDFRGPAGLGVAPVSISETIGAYFVDINVAYVSDEGGMVIVLTGTVTRTSPGTGGISVIADGGWGTPLAAGTGDLRLNGFSTGTSQTQLGGAAGFPVGLLPEQDLAYTGFPAILDVPTNGPEIFIEDLLGQPRADGAVAIHLINTFHVNVVGESISVPSFVGTGNWTGLVPRGDVVGTITLIHVDENGHYTVELIASNTDTDVSIISFFIDTDPLPDASDVSATGPTGPLDCGDIFGGFGCTTGFNVPDGAEYMMMFTGTLPPGVDQQDGVVILNKDFNTPVEAELFFRLVRPVSQNSAPEVVSPIPDLSLVASGDDFTVDLNTVFSDADGDILGFAATSSDPSVAEATISNGILTVKALTKGTATVTITADDGQGGTAETAANVNVPTGVHTDEIDNVIPAEFELYQNYPNPFNPTTTIRFDVPEMSRVNLFVYDILGRQVANIMEGVVTAGKHTATFTARGLPSGAYIFRLETPEVTLTKTMLLLK